MTGLFGGTFNPIHVGHLQAARDVADALGLGRVVFIPNASPPHKDTSAVAAADRKSRRDANSQRQGDRHARGHAF